MVYKGATSRVRGKVITKVVTQEFKTRQDIIEVNADRFDVTKSSETQTNTAHILVLNL